MTISATDILVPVCSKMPLLYLLTQKVAQKFGYVLGIFYDGDCLTIEMDGVKANVKIRKKANFKTEFYSFGTQSGFGYSEH